MSQRFASQELGHRVWSIVRLFYESLVNFREQRDRYEEKVLAYAQREGIEREVLRLKSDELAGLLDFKSLERLRDEYIYELKNLCHLVFRSQDHTDLLDRYVSDIFHEISILKEEHYTVKTYAPMYERDEDEVELGYILDEAHQLFPLKLRQIQYLFDKAKERMEEHLPSFRAMPIFIRSLYLHREGLVEAAYADGLLDFYRIMYPWGPLEGYYQVGLSFYHSGFAAEALETFRLALGEAPSVHRSSSDGDHEASEDAGAPLGGHARASRFRRGASHDELHAILRSLRTKVRRLERGMEHSKEADRRTGATRILPSRGSSRRNDKVGGGGTTSRSKDGRRARGRRSR